MLFTHYFCKQLFAAKQEGVRKDVERAFGVLKARFAIVREAARLHKKIDLRNIMETCVILHNMIIEDEEGLDLPAVYDRELGETPVFERVSGVDFTQTLERHRQIMDTGVHNRLLEDLMDYNWDLHSRQLAQQENN